MEDRLEANWNAIRQRIRDACLAADRPPEDVELLAVTKKVPPAVAARLFDLGQGSLGENRLPELERKAEAFEALQKRPHWHFIGTLQRNKARRVVETARTLHSVDSLRLAETLARHATDLGVRPACYLQVNVSDETEKHGFSPRELPAALEAVREFESLETLGLMGMAPRLDGASDADKRAAARQAFDRLVALGEAHRDDFANGTPRYSMGMSGDLEEAVHAGTHVVRIGTALFEGIEDEDAA